MGVRIDKLLDLVVGKGASDLHMCVGTPPMLRLDGRLRAIGMPPLTPEDTVAVMKAISSERRQTELSENGGSDFGFTFREKARFRVAIFRQRGHVGLVLRQIPNKLLTLDQIGINPYVKNLLFKPRGLFLVTGPTGSGKTTSLASMIDFINTESDRHILTVEDPIEYYHSNKKSIITQREVGIDVPSFTEAIRRGLRMDPDVLLIGEMRDLETISAALTAAETGHLVFATLHTTGAAETVNRIIDAYPSYQQEQVRVQLAQTLLCVLSQTLIPLAKGKGRIAAFEVMTNPMSIAHSIRENKIHRIASIIQSSAQHGMVLLGDHLFELFSNKKIKYKDAVQAAPNSIAFEKRVRESGLI